ncbi:MAG: NADH-quinone oxidoreductase subunit H [Deltaproteobacteria bacterium]|nr:NADH-quinone oxidoreductase subunit H [Deltaproteobacteria bacterium]
MQTVILIIISLLIIPVLAAFIKKVKALLTGKQGPPLLIKYYTLVKLFAKGSVYSTSTTFIFRFMPVVALAAPLMALLFLPLAGAPALLSFAGDAILIFYLLGLARFFTVCAALDTASPFEGMGASREAFFSVLSEATLFMVLVLFYRINGSLSFSSYFQGNNPINLWSAEGTLLLLVVAALFMVLLAENARVPVDDPATHLELTMIHEVMILDHSGPDLALIELGAWTKLYFYAAFIANIMTPIYPGKPWATALVFLLIIVFIYFAVGLVESITARSKMNLVPKFILTSFSFAFFATILTMELTR